MPRDKGQTMQVLEIIRWHFETHKRMPTNQQIADEMGWNNGSSVADALSRLVVNGHLIRKPVTDTRKSRRKFVYELAS